MYCLYRAILLSLPSLRFILAILIGAIYVIPTVFFISRMSNYIGKKYNFNNKGLAVYLLFMLLYIIITTYLLIVCMNFFNCK